MRGHPAMLEADVPSPASTPRGLRAKAGCTGLVLIAEDDEDSRELMRMLFEMNGLAVATCSDAGTALSEAIRLAPDVIVLDGRLGAEDGWTVTRLLRNHPGHVRSTPIVFVTGVGGDEAEARAQAAGCDRYLVKPVDIDELLGTVVDLIRGSAPAHG